MAMFTVYLDASGHPEGTKVLSVAGFIAHESQWILFERRWRKVLAKYGVSSLHMKDFAHSTGEFKAWKGEEEKRRSFLTELIRLIRRGVRHSFATSVYLPDYNDLDLVHHIRAVRSPLAMAGCTLIQHVRNWGIEKGISMNDILLVFEDGDADKTNLFQAVKHDFGISLVFMKKQQRVAFQAADLLAYEHLKANLKVIPKSGVYALDELRHPLQELHEIPHGEDGKDWSIQERDELERTFKELWPHLGLKWPS